MNDLSELETVHKVVGNFDRILQTIVKCFEFQKEIDR